MKNVSVRLFAIIYTLTKTLNKKLEEMKTSIVEGATLVDDNYANVKLVECTRKDWSKEDKIILDKIAQEKGMTKVETKYVRVEIDNIDKSITTTVNNIFNTLKLNGNTITKKVATKVTK